jgi:ATP-dependent protease Clp ATPase subunit
MFRRTLACSFGRRSAAEVDKLVAGPGVYICDRCAVEVGRIMADSHDTGATRMSPRPSASPVLRRLRGLWHRGDT